MKDALFFNSYLCLRKDGTIDISDGVGYAGSMDKSEVTELCEALKILTK